MDENYGKVYVLTPFCVAFAGDALSMYFGMWFGKRKMAPHVSPHKTWAGAIGGPIGSGWTRLSLLGVLDWKVTEKDRLTLNIERYLRQGLSEADDQGYAVALWYMRSF